ncbi:MAG: alpha/beta fold hydrolase [Variovorax sp.]|nr:MAG: alpha/beta fold hydrolase [Variovorax sp.]
MPMNLNPWTRPARFLAVCAFAFAAVTAHAADLRRVTVEDGVELAVRRTEGGRIPVFFLHGYSLSMDTWEKVLPMFPARRYTTIAYDLRGFGDSSKPPTGYTMAQHVKDLVGLMDRMNIRRAVLVGHSLGGAIGQEFATSHPERTLALVTSDAFARFTVAPPVTEPIRKRAESFGSMEQNRTLLEGAVPRYFDVRNQNSADIERFIGVTLKASTPALREQLLDAYAFPQIDIAKYKALTVPVLAATGAVDKVVPAENAILISDVVPDSEILLVPRAGHTPMWERPEAWARPVVDFLDRRVK